MSSSQKAVEINVYSSSDNNSVVVHPVSSKTIKKNKENITPCKNVIESSFVN